MGLIFGKMETSVFVDMAKLVRLRHPIPPVLVSSCFEIEEKLEILGETNLLAQLQACHTK
jgi:hypothetical protein